MSTRKCFSPVLRVCAATLKLSRHSARLLARLILLSCTATFVLPALANLVSPISVDLIAPGGLNGNPTPISVTQLLGDGSPIIPGSGAIGAFMLFPEQITFLGGFAINIRVGSFNSTGSTGYLGLGTAHARYEFVGLNMPGRTLTGIEVIVDRNLSVNQPPMDARIAVSFIDTNADTIPDRLIVDLDDLVIGESFNGSGARFGDFFVRFLSNPNDNNVPEPASLTLMAAALVALCSATKRRRVGRARSCQNAAET